MGRRCEITGKLGLYGRTVSNANNKRPKKSLANLIWKRFFVPELGRFVRVRVSNRAIRTVDKTGGLVPACRKYRSSLSERLQKVLKQAS